MYLLVSLVSLAGASYLIYAMIRDEGQEEAAITGLEPAGQEALSPRGEQMRLLLASTTAHLRNQVQAWLMRQESSLKVSSRVEQVRGSLVAATGSLRTQVQGWLERQDSNLMLSPRGEEMRRLLVSATARLRIQVRGWLGRQDSNLQLSD